jgi:hypothetical protein
MMRFVFVVFAATLVVSCGNDSEADQACEDVRALYQEMREQLKNPDIDDDGTVSVAEQSLFDATLNRNQEEIDDFVAGWYELGGCDLD